RNAPGIAHDAVEFAALDGKHDLLRAWIAGNWLELGTQQRVERHGEGLLVAAGASRSDREPGARENLLPIRHRRASPDEEARHLIIHAAEPDGVARVEFRLRGADERLHRHPTADDSDLGAVPGCGVIEIGGEIE